MKKMAWKPWHQVVRLRDDLKSGELSLSLFAADLYEVMVDRGAKVYRDPREFFSLTYPTFNLRELSKDVAFRLAGKNDKAVRQLELTYGGGKTHTLITLYHLFREPSNLPDIPAVNEFKEHIGIPLPTARIVTMAFDKLDVEKGAEIRGPKGEKLWLRNPWSVLAYQLAGSEGLKLIHKEGKAEERDSVPAENLLIELISIPQKEGLSTLILIDEVLMYTREKVALDPVWRIKLIDFFQYLTQAATKVPTCAVIASLLATDPKKSDALGKELTKDLYDIFRREREEGVQPVSQEDVSEILRRRFFTPDSIRDREAFRPHVVAALKGIVELDEQTKKMGKQVEDRFLNSYPFHPDLTEVLYSKWTNLEGFQRTRGVLRTFALALRDSEPWDQSPLIGPNVFLTALGKTGISEAARELTTVAAKEEYEGKKHEWTTIIESELDKAKNIQKEFPSLINHELEEAVFSIFLHSQPIGQKASLRDLMLLLGQTRPDKIELKKGLLRWIDTSWFLDEATVGDGAGKSLENRELPQVWRLGSKPNLNQMWNDACTRINGSPEVIEDELIGAIQKSKNLTLGATSEGIRVHVLPDKPRDIADDGEFHYVVLGPKAASEVGKPSIEAKRYIEETTGLDRPRIYRNSIIILTPAKDGIEHARKCIIDYLGWKEVPSLLKEQNIDTIDPIRLGTLKINTEKAQKSIPEAIQQAYCIVITVNEKDVINAFRLSITGEPHFELIKKDKNSRIEDSPINAEALLPDGPYNLWKAGETSRRIKDIIGSFAQFPRLPKMLQRKEIVATLIHGVKDGYFVLQTTRPDRSIRTFWREQPDENDLNDPSLEVVLPGAAQLMHLNPGLLEPNVLPGLWNKSEIIVKDITAYFSRGHVVKIPKEGYDEQIIIPRADRPIIENAIRSAVEKGQLWLRSGPGSILNEEIPEGLLSDDAIISKPPSPINVSEILPENLPEAWKNDTTTALAISLNLSKKIGMTLPWITIRTVIDSAIRARHLEVSPGSISWPCEFSEAKKMKIQLSKEKPLPPIKKLLTADAELRADQIQDFAEKIGDIKRVTAGIDLKFKLHIEFPEDAKPSKELLEKLNKILQDIDSKLEIN
jgi:hypothetical protein